MHVQESHVVFPCEDPHKERKQASGKAVLWFRV
jgi:hypothetical protein